MDLTRAHRCRKKIYERKMILTDIDRSLYYLKPSENISDLTNEEMDEIAALSLKEGCRHPEITDDMEPEEIERLLREWRQGQGLCFGRKLYGKMAEKMTPNLEGVSHCRRFGINVVDGIIQYYLVNLRIFAPADSSKLEQSIQWSMAANYRMSELRSTMDDFRGNEKLSLKLHGFGRCDDGCTFVIDSNIPERIAKNKNIIYAFSISIVDVGRKEGHKVVVLTDGKQFYLLDPNPNEFFPSEGIMFYIQVVDGFRRYLNATQNWNISFIQNVDALKINDARVYKNPDISLQDGNCGLIGNLSMFLARAFFNNKLYFSDRLVSPSTIGQGVSMKPLEKLVTLFQVGFSQTEGGRFLVSLALSRFDNWVRTGEREDYKIHINSRLDRVRRSLKEGRTPSGWSRKRKQTEQKRRRKKSKRKSLKNRSK